MKLLIATLLILASVYTQNAFSAGLCDDPIRQSEVCIRMQNLRATVNTLDAQRDLMQVNYPYMQVLSRSLYNSVDEIIKKIQMENKEHIDGLRGVANFARELESQAVANDPRALMTANLIRTQCLTCHTSQNPPSGIRWDQIFKNDWDGIVKKCNQPGRNPYLCKNMNGMLSAYGYILTAYSANVQNFEMTESVSNEIVRILEEIKKNNFLHMTESIRAEVETEARIVAEMAKQKNPEVFERASNLPTLCMKCHDNNGVRLPSSVSQLKVSPFVKK